MASVIAIVYGIIALTRSNGINEYLDGRGVNKSITCTRTDCHLICDTPQECFNTSVDASQSETLTILCTANFSCKSLSILSPPSKTFNIYCNQNIESCSNANINVSSTTNVNIICNATSTSTSTKLVNDTTCNNFKLNAANSTNVNIQCRMYIQFFLF